MSKGSKRGRTKPCTKGDLSLNILWLANCAESANPVSDTHACRVPRVHTSTRIKVKTLVYVCRVEQKNRSRGNGSWRLNGPSSRKHGVETTPHREDSPPLLNGPSSRRHGVETIPHREDSPHLLLSEARSFLLSLPLWCVLWSWLIHKLLNDVLSLRPISP